MPLLRLGVSLQPRWPLDDGSSVLRAARRAENLGFDHVASATDSWTAHSASTPTRSCCCRPSRAQRRAYSC